MLETPVHFEMPTCPLIAAHQRKCAAIFRKLRCHIHADLDGLKTEKAIARQIERETTAACIEKSRKLLSEFSMVKRVHARLQNHDGPLLSQARIFICQSILNFAHFLSL